MNYKSIKILITIIVAIIIIYMVVYYMSLSKNTEVSDNKNTTLINNIDTDENGLPGSGAVIDTDIEECITMWNNTYLNFDLKNPNDYEELFYPGVINVAFIEETTRENNIQYLESQGLNVLDYIDLLRLAKTAVPTNQELAWACTLDQEQIVDYVSLAPKPAPLP